MIYKNVELFNVAEIRETPDGTGASLYRFTLDAIDHIKGIGAKSVRSSTGCEIRFVTNATEIWVTLEALTEDVGLTVFLGDLEYQRLHLEGGRKKTFILNRNSVFDRIDKDVLNSSSNRFPTDLWRIHVNYSHTSHCLAFHEAVGLDGIVRPPLPTEQPQKKFIAYGSSITHGCGSGCTGNGYIQHAARLLGIDVLNKGIAAGCQCEKAVCDFIKNAEWDFAMFELGVNMYDRKTKDFKRVVDYLINAVHETNPDKKIFVVTPYISVLSMGTDKDYKGKHADYVKILEDIVAEINSENVILINGESVSDSLMYFTADLLHPSDFGHVRMGENLSKILKEYI